MTRVCIIGNSHVASLRGGIEKVEPRSGISYTFFAARGRALEDLVLSGSTIIPANEKLRKYISFTSGGKTAIDTAKYDVYLVYGAHAAPYFHNSEAVFSEAALRSATRDHVSGTLSMKLIKLLRSCTTSPIYVGHYPLRAAQKVRSVEVDKEYIDGCHLLNELVYAPLDAKLLRQPKSTIVNGRQTHPDYTKNSRRLAVGREDDQEILPENDIVHMNYDFGEIWMQMFLREIEAA